MKYKTHLMLCMYLFTLILSIQAVANTPNSLITTSPSVVSPHLKVSSRHSHNVPFEIKVVSFSSGKLLLHGIIYKPIGPGPFPALLFNHGSALNTKEASDSLGPIYARHGWVFFMPSRRGQGLSRNVGHYIGNEIENARKKRGEFFAAETMVQLLKGDHLNDQMAALNWLRKQNYVATNQIAVAGVSFGGIQSILGVEKVQYCAGIDAAGAAQSWSKAPQLQKLMLQSVKNAKAPIFFFQAKNDYNLTPTHVLSADMQKARKKFQMKIYPSFGKTVQDGHAFGYFGGSVWSKDVFIFLNKYCR
ncbi:alpha/beta hydrolase family protein [Legionella anisa]|uniref:alpha/beta hydrolase family protein n=1 Tax=Legionella anisa TaxID=28082 RepID=UPI00104122F4|nr:prolyl oligopeptidase family serine peptidase [Legionella anisa]